MKWRLIVQCSCTSFRWLEYNAFQMILTLVCPSASSNKMTTTTVCIWTRHLQRKVSLNAEHEICSNRHVDQILCSYSLHISMFYVSHCSELTPYFLYIFYYSGICKIIIKILLLYSRIVITSDWKILRANITLIICNTPIVP